MAKRIVALLLMLMLVFTSLSTVYAAKEEKVSGTRYVISENGKKVNIRTGPGKGNRKAPIGSVPVGTELNVVGKTKDDEGNLWYHIKNDNFEGWIMKEYTTKDKPSSGNSGNPTNNTGNKQKSIPEKAIDFVKKHLQCGLNGCTALAEKKYGEWKSEAIRRPDGGYNYVEMRHVLVHCINGHYQDIVEQR